MKEYNLKIKEIDHMTVSEAIALGRNLSIYVSNIVKEKTHLATSEIAGDLFHCHYNIYKDIISPRVVEAEDAMLSVTIENIIIKEIAENPRCVNRLDFATEIHPLNLLTLVINLNHEIMKYMMILLELTNAHQHLVSMVSNICINCDFIAEMMTQEYLRLFPEWKNENVIEILSLNINSNSE